MLIEHVKRESRQGIRNALPKVCFMFRRYFFNTFGVERKRAYGLIDCSIALMTLLKIHIRYRTPQPIEKWFAKLALLTLCFEITFVEPKGLLTHDFRDPISRS